MERGTVSSRVALLLRSAEVKPLFNRFVQLLLNLFSFLPRNYSRAGLKDFGVFAQSGGVPDLEGWWRLKSIHGHRTLKAPHPV